MHPENYLMDAGARVHLRRARAQLPISFHAVGLSLGSVEGVARESLERLKSLVEEIDPGLVSDHLSFSVVGGRYLPDLFPLPYSAEALAIVARNVNRAQEYLGRRLLVENPSVYLSPAGQEFDEASFLAELVRLTGCGVLLDVNNVQVSAVNTGQSPREWLQRLLGMIPPQAVGEIHLAGHAERILSGGQRLLIDDHGSAVRAEVWDLYREALARLGPVPTLVEWDLNVPAWETLAAEAQRAAALLAASDDAPAPAAQPRQPAPAPSRTSPDRLAQWQTDMATYALSRDESAHRRLTVALAPTPVPPAVSLEVHADCVQAGLRNALAKRVPTVVAMVGEEFFSGLAHDYACEYPPDAPQLSCWGDALPDFIDRREDCAVLPWLADLAAFDLALDRVAWADPAEECPPILLDEDYSLQPMPGLRVLRVQYPVDELRDAVTAELAGDTEALGRLNMASASRHLVLWCAEDAQVRCQAVSPGMAIVLNMLLGFETGPAETRTRRALMVLMGSVVEESAVPPSNLTELLEAATRRLTECPGVRVIPAED